MGGRRETTDTVHCGAKISATCPMDDTYALFTLGACAGGLLYLVRLSVRPSVRYSGTTHSELIIVVREGSRRFDTLEPPQTSVVSPVLEPHRTSAYSTLPCTPPLKRCSCCFLYLLNWFLPIVPGYSSALS